MERIKVAIRLRPFLTNENDSDTGINLDPDDDRTIMITKSFRTFRGIFDKILPTDSTQKDVFDFIKPCIQSIQKGNNCTILTYGQTGSGKTYTMFGGSWSFAQNLNTKEKNKNLQNQNHNLIQNNVLVIDPYSETNGIIPNLIMELHNIYINNKNKEENETNNNLIITCSYLQIYNEKLYDLLEEIDERKNIEVYENEKFINQTPLKLKYDKTQGIIIEGANEIQTQSFFDLYDILAQGEINRKIRQTNKNDMSSRSHTIFIVDIEDFNSKIKSKIKLCDLAGSERFKSSETYNKQHINEIKYINKSLFVLGNVIHFLAKKRKPKFIPYKDSKLTQLLEDSLSENSYIYLIATISPDDDSFDETINTLKFADRAREVMISISPNQLANSEVFGNNKKEINKLYKELSSLKQLLALREKRGNLNPLQSQLIKLQKENYQLKKYLGGGENINTFEKLIKENNNLKKEIKELSSQNSLLKNENKVFHNLENYKKDYNVMLNQLKRKNFINSLSEDNLFNNYKYNNKKRFKNKNNNNYSTLIHTGNSIILNKNDSEDKLFKKLKEKYDKNGKIKNKANRLKEISNIYGTNYNNINISNLGIKEKYNKNNNILECLKRLKILDDLSKKNDEYLKD